MPYLVATVVDLTLEGDSKDESYVHVFQNQESADAFLKQPLGTTLKNTEAEGEMTETGKITMTREALEKALSWAMEVGQENPPPDEEDKGELTALGESIRDMR
jgi:hypothetical protein